MDIAELNKIANRKKMTSDAERLRERVNRENRKIIKLRVAQDTAYWDVKEKLRQTQTNHEKLQQNMVDLQMQYETVSGKYQDELRFRPETLNKLASTREICDVLEDYSERLRDTLSRCKADQASLREAYQTSGQVVRDLKDKQIRANEKSQFMIENLQEKNCLTTEHNAKMIQFFNCDKQRMESELQETKTKLSEASTLKEELLSAGRELTRELDACRRDVQKKQECINTLQKDMKRMFKEFNVQASERNNAILKQKEENKELTSTKEALQQALTNQEAFTTSVVSEKNTLQEKVADLENEVSKKDGCIAEMQENIQDAKLTNESLTMTITNIEQEKNEIISNMEIELQNLTRHLSSLETEKSDAEAAASRAVNEVKALDSRVQQITAAGQDLEGKLQEVENKMEADREAMAKKTKQLTTALEEKERELAGKAGTISKLMGDVKHGLDVQTELDATMQKVKRDMESERQRMGERESQLVAKIAQLEISMKGKDDELRSKDQEFNKNITVIRDLRGDKERLNLNIVAMQSKIDNIQKELTGPLSLRQLTAADLDDNAVMLTPNPPKMSQQLRQLSPVFVPQRPEERNPNNDDLIFNFLSDSSMEGSLDPVEVNRRFAAISRGEHLSPVHHSALKKRRTSASTSGTPLVQFNFKPPQQKDRVPLSQMKSAAAAITTTAPKKDKERTFYKHKPRRGGEKRSSSKLDKE